MGRERRDIDERSNPLVHPSVCDQGTTVRVANEHHGTADPTKAAGDARHVAFQGVEAVLGCHHFVALGLQRRDQFAEA
jgi:hypothetical protein